MDSIYSIGDTDGAATAVLRRCVITTWRFIVPPGKVSADSLIGDQSPLQSTWSRKVETGYMLCSDVLLSRTSEFAVPGPTTAVLRWLVVNVSERVKSHSRQRPRVHGTIVKPSGILPSLQLSDAGFRTAGVSVDVIARLMRSLTALCRKWRPDSTLETRRIVSSCCTNLFTADADMSSTDAARLQS